MPSKLTPIPYVPSEIYSDPFNAIGSQFSSPTCHHPNMTSIPLLSDGGKDDFTQTYISIPVRHIAQAGPPARAPTAMAEQAWPPTALAIRASGTKVRHLDG